MPSKINSLVTFILTLFETAKVTDAAAKTYMRGSRTLGADDTEELAKHTTIEESSEVAFNDSLLPPTQNTMLFTGEYNATARFNTTAMPISTFDPQEVPTKVFGNIDPSTVAEVRDAALKQFQGVIDKPEYMTCTIRKVDPADVGRRELSGDLEFGGRKYTVQSELAKKVKFEQHLRKKTKNKIRGLLNDEAPDSADDDVESIQEVEKISSYLSSSPDAKHSASGVMTEIIDQQGNSTRFAKIYADDRHVVVMRIGTDYEVEVVINKEGLLATGQKFRMQMQAADAATITNETTEAPSELIAANVTTGARLGRRLAIPKNAKGEIILTYTFAFTALSAEDQGYPSNPNALIAFVQNILDSFKKVHQLAGVTGYEYRAKISVGGEPFAINNAYNALSWATRIAAADLNTDYVIGIYSGRQNDMQGIAGVAGLGSCGPGLRIAYGKVVGINNKGGCSAGSLGYYMYILHEVGHVNGLGHFEGQQRSDAPSKTNFNFAAELNGFDFKATIMSWNANQMFYSSSAKTNGVFGDESHDNSKTLRLNIGRTYGWREWYDTSTSAPTVRGAPTLEPTMPPTFSTSLSISPAVPYAEFTVNNFNQGVSSIICGDPEERHTEIIFGNGAVHVKQYMEQSTQIDVGISYNEMDLSLLDSDVLSSRTVNFKIEKSGYTLIVWVKDGGQYKKLCVLNSLAFGSYLTNPMSFGTDSPNILKGAGATARPSKQATPTNKPSAPPVQQPVTLRPTAQSTNAATSKPTQRPTRKPTLRPSIRPSKFPSKRPSKIPTRLPTHAPTFDITPVLAAKQGVGIKYDARKNIDAVKVFSIDLGAQRINIKNVNNVITAQVYKVTKNSRGKETLTLLKPNTDYVLNADALKKLTNLNTGETVFRVINGSPYVYLDVDINQATGTKPPKVTVTPIITLQNQPANLNIKFNDPQVAAAVAATAPFEAITSSPTVKPSKAPSSRPSKRPATAGRQLDDVEVRREALHFDLIELVKYVAANEEKNPQIEAQLEAISKSAENTNELIKVICNFAHQHNPTSHSEETIVSEFMNLMIQHILQRVPEEQREQFTNKLISLQQEGVNDANHGGIAEVYQMYLTASSLKAAPDNRETPAAHIGLD